MKQLIKNFKALLLVIPLKVKLVKHTEDPFTAPTPSILQDFEGPPSHHPA